MKRVILLKSELDWEGLYVDGKCVCQGHELYEGEGPYVCILSLAKKYNFTIDDFITKWLSDHDEDKLGAYGRLPENINELKGNYNE